jgi:hypothetical protein
MIYTTFKLSINPSFPISMRANTRHTQFSVKISVPTAVIMKSTNFCNVTHCSMVEDYFHLQGLSRNSASTLKTEVVHSSKTV